MQIRHTLTALAAGTVALATFSVAPVASAATSTGPVAAPEEQPSVDPARVERACARIPNLVLRSENLLDRIQADAETRGSLLWLDRRIQNAIDNGRTDLAEALQNRRGVREASIPVLQLRLEQLAGIAARCAEAGF